jgi:alkylated DNA repair dioxygenase AlkB
MISIDDNAVSEALFLPNATVEYCQNFIKFEQATAIYQQLLNEISWRQDNIKMFGKVIAIPRLQAWYGDNQLTYRYSNITLTALPWTKTLWQLKGLVNDYCQFDFNAVLVNQYRNEHDSVGWHSDNEAELGSNPVIASLSFGAEREFLLRHNVSKEKCKLMLANGSLLKMSGLTQAHYQHSIAKQTHTCLPRINLTFRKIII